MSNLPDYSKFNPMLPQASDPAEEIPDYLQHTLSGLPIGRGVVRGESRPPDSQQAADYLAQAGRGRTHSTPSSNVPYSEEPLFRSMPTSNAPQRAPFPSVSPLTQPPLPPFSSPRMPTKEDSVFEGEEVNLDDPVDDPKDVEEDSEDDEYLLGEDEAHEEEDEESEVIPFAPQGFASRPTPPSTGPSLSKQPVEPPIRVTRNDLPPPAPGSVLIEKQPTSRTMSDLPAQPQKKKQEAVRNLDVDLNRLMLKDNERDALLEMASTNPNVLTALLKITGPAIMAHQMSAGDPTEGDDLKQEIAAGREMEVSVQAIRFLHNTSNETALLERLREDANKLQVIEQPLNLVQNQKGRPGNPKPLGRVVAFSIWWFREIPRSAKDQDKSRWKDYAGTALEFLNDVLGRRSMMTTQNNVPTALIPGDYLAFELEVDLMGAIEKVYFLSPVKDEGNGRSAAAVPSSSADTKYRFVQGLVDGFSVIDQSGEVRRIYDRLTYAPMVLSRIRIPSMRGQRKDEDECPVDTKQLRKNLEDEGLHLQCSSSYGGGPMWYLEPSWMAMGSGFRVIESDIPQITPGTKDFANRLQAIRDRARRDIRNQGIPRNQLMRLMLSGGALNIDPEVLSRVLREQE